jgi:hypothetical protein
MSKTNVNAKLATIKLSDAQRRMMSAALQREDRCVARPVSLRSAQVLKLSETLIAAGYAREVRAKASAPTWRREGETGLSFSLKLTAAGARAITVEDTPAASEQVAAVGDALHVITQAPSPEAAQGTRAPATPSSLHAPVQIEPRSTSKIAAVIGLLSRAQGASLAELIASTGWLPHTTRAALTGLRKRGYLVVLDRTDRQQGSVYRVPSQEDRDALKSSERAAEAA